MSNSEKIYYEDPFILEEKLEKDNSNLKNHIKLLQNTIKNLKKDTTNKYTSNISNLEEQDLQRKDSKSFLNNNIGFNIEESKEKKDYIPHFNYKTTNTNNSVKIDFVENDYNDYNIKKESEKYNDKTLDINYSSIYNNKSFGTPYLSKVNNKKQNENNRNYEISEENDNSKNKDRIYGQNINENLNKSYDNKTDELTSNLNEYSNNNFSRDYYNNTMNPYKNMIYNQNNDILIKENHEKTTDKYKRFDNESNLLNRIDKVSEEFEKSYYQDIANSNNFNNNNNNTNNTNNTTSQYISKYKNENKFNPTIDYGRNTNKFGNTNVSNYQIENRKNMHCSFGDIDKHLNNKISIEPSKDLDNKLNFDYTNKDSKENHPNTNKFNNERVSDNMFSKKNCEDNFNLRSNESNWKKDIFSKVENTNSFNNTSNIYSGPSDYNTYNYKTHDSNDILNRKIDKSINEEIKNFGNIELNNASNNINRYNIKFENDFLSQNPNNFQILSEPSLKLNSNNNDSQEYFANKLKSDLCRKDKINENNFTIGSNNNNSNANTIEKSYSKSIINNFSGKKIDSSKNKLAPSNCNSNSGNVKVKNKHSYNPPSNIIQKNKLINKSKTKLQENNMHGQVNVNKNNEANFSELIKKNESLVKRINQLEKINKQLMYKLELEEKKNEKIKLLANEVSMISEGNVKIKKNN